jgi:hypothetical protein
MAKKKNIKNPRTGIPLEPGSSQRKEIDGAHAEESSRAKESRKHHAQPSERGVILLREQLPWPRSSPSQSREVGFPETGTGTIPRAQLRGAMTAAENVTEVAFYCRPAVRQVAALKKSVILGYISLMPSESPASKPKYPKPSKRTFETSCRCKCS